jgi:hypothetical protein
VKAASGYLPVRPDGILDSGKSLGELAGELNPRECYLVSNPGWDRTGISPSVRYRDLSSTTRFS